MHYIYDTIPAVKGPYVHAIEHDGTLYVSGLTALDTSAMNRGLKEQTITILQQIDLILKHHNKNKKDLIKVTIFVRDIKKISLIRQVLFNFYDGTFPACSIVEVSGLIHHDLHIEIEAIIAL